MMWFGGDHFVDVVVGIRSEYRVLIVTVVIGFGRITTAIIRTRKADCYLSILDLSRYGVSF